MKKIVFIALVILLFFASNSYAVRGKPENFGKYFSDPKTAWLDYENYSPPQPLSTPWLKEKYYEHPSLKIKRLLAEGRQKIFVKPVALVSMGDLFSFVQSEQFVWAKKIHDALDTVSRQLSDAPPEKTLKNAEFVVSQIKHILKNKKNVISRHLYARLKKTFASGHR